MQKIPNWFIGEFFGTFLLVFFGCGSVCAAVLTGAQVGVFQVAIVWGLGIATAIHLTGALSGAHLNPAVTLSMAVWSDFPKSQLAAYFGAQLVGAFVGASMLYFIFGDALIAFEKMNNIARGQPGCAGHAARNWHSRNPKSQSEPGPPELLLNRSQKTRHDNSHSKCKLTHITNSQNYDEAI